MSSRLIDDPDGVSALAAQVSDRLGIPAEHVEKDFWVTEVLRGAVHGAAQAGVVVVFKGGTSLSKAFGLIQRFSEDVDMLVIYPEEMRTPDRERALKTIVRGASDATALDTVSVPGATSKGKRRGARFNYRGDADPGAGLSAGVFLELGSSGGAMPSSVEAVRSLIVEHAADLVADSAEVESVNVRVLRPERTLVEKLILLHTAHSLNNEHDALRGARHYYDVHRLLSVEYVLDALSNGSVEIIARDVCTYSKEADRDFVPRPAGGFAASPAFADGPMIDAVRTEYERRVLGELLWRDSERPSFDECLDLIRACGPRL